MIEIQRAQIDEIIFARLEQGADLMLQLHEVCKRENIKTGVVMDITGSLQNMHIEHFPSIGFQFPPTADLANVSDVESILLDVEGPLEVSGHGLIGEGWAPGIEPPDPRGFFYASFKQHGDPYLHVHIVGSNAETTVCGHLLEGSILYGSPDYGSRCTVVIAKTSGVHLRAVWDQQEGKPTTIRHEFVSN